jgi:pimeloyl-ACP methyl ester carboxylesterase/SAM-dependent methyltransferase
MYNKLKEINEKPELFQYYTADELWTDEHTSKKMLDYHLNEKVDISSRNIEFINRSVDWIVEFFDLTEESVVLDLGCGPGLYTNRLGEKADLTGVDFSERSIEYAQKTAFEKGLKVHYEHRNYLEFETDRKFDLIIIIMCDYCALSPEQRKMMLEKFSRMLKSGGKVLLDVYSLNAFDEKNESAGYEFNFLDNFWSEEDYYCFINTYKYEKEKVILDQYTVIEQERERHIYNWLQYFSPDSLKNEVEDSGMKVKQIFADVAGKEYAVQASEFAVILEKDNNEAKNFRCRDMNINYIDKGQGEVLILLPGNTASSAVHENEIAFLSENYRVICPDYMGYGKSDRMESFPADFLWQNACMCCKLIESLGIKQCIAIGTSGGGIVALNMALHCPDLINAVVADSIPGEYFGEEKAEELVEERKKRTKEQIVFWKMAHGEDWEQVVDADTDMIIRQVASGETLYKGKLSDIKCPVLITGSLEDEEIKNIQKSNLEIVEQINQVETYYHETGFHPLMWSASDVFWDKVISFLKKQ